MMIAAAFSFVARMSATSAFWLFLSLLVTTSITKSTAFVTPKNVVVRNVALHASWSDSKAVMDYQNFLASGQQNIQLARDGAAVIVKPLSGDTLLADCLFESGMGNDVVITPDQPLPAMETDDFPIYITLPPTQLEALLDNCPPSLEAKYDNFVFFSGGRTYGNIEDVLKQRGYCRDSMTQVLISGLKINPHSKRPVDISVKLGLDSYGEEKMSGSCTACGKWHGAIAERLERNNVDCQTDFYREWRRKMWERSVYDAVFYLIGAVRSEPTTVANVANYYGDEFSDMVWNISQLLRGWKALTLLYGFEERLLGFAEQNGEGEPCTLTNEMYPFIWGNPVYLQSKMFVDYLHFAQEDRGMLQGIELPQDRGDEQFKSKMRQGNLRADGVV